MRTRRKIALAAAAAGLLVGCDASIKRNDGNATGAAPVSAEGKAEEGKIAFSAPGFDVKMSVPLDKADTEQDGKILYPGSKISGMYIAANPKSGSGSDGEVELRFVSVDPPAQVANWYRDPARSGDFKLDNAAAVGAGFVFAGTQRDDGQSFKLRLGPRPGGGTDGRLTVRDKD